MVYGKEALRVSVAILAQAASCGQLFLRAPSWCGIMTAQFCSMGSVSTSWKRKTRRIKLAICRQAVFDVMQFNARDPYFVADPTTFPAFG
eukprot:2305697-Pyramimonas_sp.AAC.1